MQRLEKTLQDKLNEVWRMETALQEALSKEEFQSLAGVFEYARKHYIAACAIRDEVIQHEDNLVALDYGLVKDLKTEMASLDEVLKVSDGLPLSLECLSVALAKDSSNFHLATVCTAARVWKGESPAEILQRSVQAFLPSIEPITETHSPSDSADPVQTLG